MELMTNSLPKSPVFFVLCVVVNDPLPLGHFSTNSNGFSKGHRFLVHSNEALRFPRLKKIVGLGSEFWRDEKHSEAMGNHC